MLLLNIIKGIKIIFKKEKKMLENEKVGMEPEMPDMCQNSSNP
jgi:hypothetical protein